MNDVRVYIASTDYLSDPAVYSKVYSLRKVDSFRFEKDKRASLAAGHLLSKALSDIGVDESGLILEVTPNGHPFFRNRQDIHFSLSHSGNRAMCVISDSPVGCDVEIIEENGDVDLDRWTAMESYLKATDGVIDELLDFQPE